MSSHCSSIVSKTPSINTIDISTDDTHATFQNELTKALEQLLKNNKNTPHECHVCLKIEPCDCPGFKTLSVANFDSFDSNKASTNSSLRNSQDFCFKSFKKEKIE